MIRIETDKICLKTTGQGDYIDITSKIASLIQIHSFQEGNVTCFVQGSTASLTTIEYEPGLKSDMNSVLENIAPKGRNWQHHLTWGDDNGSSHIRSALIGTSIVIPFKDGLLLNGTWQQITFCEFDTRNRDRTIIVQIIGK